MKEINEDTYYDVISQGKVFVDFWAPWCGPCKTQAPIIESIEPKFSDITFVKVNIDKNMILANKLGIKTIPQLILYENGVEKRRYSGIMPKHELIAELD